MRPTIFPGRPCVRLAGHPVGHALMFKLLGEWRSARPPGLTAPKLYLGAASLDATSFDAGNCADGSVWESFASSWSIVWLSLK